MNIEAIVFGTNFYGRFPTGWTIRKEEKEEQNNNK